jgi:hypothetical protein
MGNMVFSQTGALKGTVRDKKTRETIVGANVIIDGTTKGAATDLDGNYQIINIQPGNYKVKVSIISYETKISESIVIEKNRTTVLDLELEEISTLIQSVDVIAHRKTDTQLSMISSIKNSKLVICGISNQQFERTLDKDASEIIKRVAGITIIDNRFIVVRGLIERYNTVLINRASTPSFESDAKAFSFDVIPSSTLDRIVIYKTPAPELPAEFAGAVVEIYTKNLPDKNSMSAGLSSSLEENCTFSDFYMYKGGKFDWLGFDDGTRSLPDGFPSTYVLDTLKNFHDGLTPEMILQKQNIITNIGRSFNKIWTANQYKSKPSIGLSFSIARKFKLAGLNAGNISYFNYSNKNSFEETNLSRFESVYNNSDTIFSYIDKEYKNMARVSILNNWSLILNPDNTIEFRNLLNQIGESGYTFRKGNDYYRGANTVSYELGYMSRTIYSGQIGGKHTFNNDRSNLDWNIGYSYVNKNQPDIRRLYYILNENPDDVNYGKYGMQLPIDATPEMIGRLFLKMNENILNTSLNFVQKLNIGDFWPEFKAGLYIEERNRDFSARNIGFTVARSSLFNSNLCYLPVDSIFSYTNINYTYGIKIDEKSKPTDSYTANNQLLAAYIAANLPFTPLFTVYAGVRAEKNIQKLYGFQAPVDTTNKDIIIDTLNFFPSINMSYDLTENSLIRLAYGLTVNRPEFREIAPYAYYDFEQSSTIRGYEFLKNAYIHNWDFRFEWYPSPAEIVTLGLFYKKFINPIEMSLFPSSNGWDYKPINAESAISLGAEIDVSKSFRNLENYKNLLYYLRFFSLQLNASVVKSEVISDVNYVRDKSRAMQGQSPYIVNCGLIYSDDKDLMISVMYNIIGKRIIVVGTPQDPNVYEMPRNLLDLTVSKKLNNHLYVKCGIKDIINDKVIFKQFVSYKDSTGANIERDQLLKSYNPGRSLVFGVTYLF